MKKEKFLEMQKHLGGSFEDAKIIASFINKLTPDGFEQYITDFFKQQQFGFNVIRNGGMDDKGIDVKAARTNQDGSKTFLIVQCKKWEAYHIKENDIAMFYGKVVDTARMHDCKIIFVATTWFTIGAKEFCEQKKIEYVDYKGLLEFNSEFPLDAWINQMQSHADKAKYLEECKLADSKQPAYSSNPNRYIPKYVKSKKWNSHKNYQNDILDNLIMKLLLSIIGLFVLYSIGRFF